MCIEVTWNILWPLINWMKHSYIILCRFGSSYRILIRIVQIIISVCELYSKKTPMLFNMNLLIRFTIKHASIWICANNDPVEVFLRLFSLRLKITIPLLSMIYQQRRTYSVGSEMKNSIYFKCIQPMLWIIPNQTIYI